MKTILSAAVLHFVCTLLFLHLIHPANADNDESTLNVERLSVGKSEPYIGQNEFRNEHNLCFFSYCWNKRAHCGRGFCCWCQCKEHGTFLSQELGCLSGSQMRNVLADEGLCQFYTLRHKFENVPLFKDAAKVNNIKIGLSPLEKSFTLSENSTCYAGMIYYYDYKHLKLLYNNKCSEKMLVYRDAEGGINMQWRSTNKDDWTKMGGLLLKMDVHCSGYNVSDYKSCIIFQIEGEANKDLSFPIPDVLPFNYNHDCPTVQPITLPPIITTTSNTSQETSITVPTTKSTDATTLASATKNATNSSHISGDLPTDFPAIIEGSGGGNIVGIVAGLLTVIVLLLACIIVMLYLRKRRSLKNHNGNNIAAVPIMSSPRPPVQRNYYEDQSILYEKPTDSGKDPEYYDDKACLYVSVDDDNLPPKYSSIEDEPDYEPPSSAMSTLKRTSYDMSKRPLPKRPNEVSNPYYAPSGGCHDLSYSDERSKENDALYSIYSSIENLKPT